MVPPTETVEPKISTLGLLWDHWTVSQRYCVLLRTPLPMHLVEFLKMQPWSKITNHTKGSIGRIVHRDGPEPWRSY